MMHARMRTETAHQAEQTGVDGVAVVDQVLTLLRQRSRQDAEPRACNVHSADGLCTSGVAWHA